MLVSFLRVLILYPVVVFGIRLMGKRQLGELQPTELVVTILISNIATLPLEDQNLPLLMSIVPMLLLVCFEVLLSWGVLKSRRLRHLLSGSPQVIIRGGKINREIMQALRFSLDDLMTALRGSGVFDITEVQLAVVETNGKVSVYQKAPARPVTCADLQLRPDAKDPPEVLIADGCIIEGTVENCILFRGVHIEAGAVVRNSIIMQDGYVNSGAELDNCILDKQTVVRSRTRLIAPRTYPIVIAKNMTV